MFPAITVIATRGDYCRPSAGACAYIQREREREIQGERERERERECVRENVVRQFWSTTLTKILNICPIF